MASSPDQIAAALSQFGTLGLGIAISAVPVVAAVTAYVTRMSYQGKIDRLNASIEFSERESAGKFDSFKKQHEDLELKYQDLLKSGALIQVQLRDIVNDAGEVALRLDAQDYSILVPAPTSIPGEEPEHLVFLYVSGDQAAALKWVRVPIKQSLSGKVYATGITSISSPTRETFSNITDRISEYKTDEILSVAMKYKNSCVGIAQFLNKRGQKRFDINDIEKAQYQCSALSVRVADFISDPRRLIELGFASRQNQVYATMMYIDMSNFSKLFKALDPATVTDMLNQYFFELCSIALGKGAAIDQFMGDGAFLTFNIMSRRENHEKTALSVAQEMRGAFHTLRERWRALGYVGAEELFLRVSIGCGWVNRADIGHFQASHSTVVGAAVNDTAYACQMGPRGRDTIVLTKDMRDVLRIEVKTVETPNGEPVFEVV